MAMDNLGVLRVYLATEQHALQQITKFMVGTGFAMAGLLRSHVVFQMRESGGPHGRRAANAGQRGCVSPDRSLLTGRRGVGIIGATWRGRVTLAAIARLPRFARNDKKVMLAMTETSPFAMTNPMENYHAAGS